jgi:hypothetical protein
MNNMQQVPDKNALLTRINELKQGIEDVKRKRTTQLRTAQAALLESNTAKEDQVTRQNVDYIEDEINTALRYLRDQLKRIADTPGCGTSGPAEHYTIAKKSLQDEITAYQGDQSNFHKRLEEQVRRRYQMANPEATPDQLEAGVQAVMQGQEQAFMVGSFPCDFDGIYGIKISNYLFRPPELVLARPTMPARLPSPVPLLSGRSRRIWLILLSCSLMSRNLSSSRSLPSPRSSRVPRRPTAMFSKPTLSWTVPLPAPATLVAGSGMR